MGLFDGFGKKDVSEELTTGVPYALKVGFHPYSITANKSDGVQLKIALKNVTREPLLTAIVVKVSKKLGLDQTCLQQAREIRLGELSPGEEKEMNIDVFSSTKTDPGEYPVEVTAIAHYRTYTYVLNSEKKKATLRAV
jgi:uncharacterized membrane protein